MLLGALDLNLNELGGHKEFGFQAPGPVGLCDWMLGVFVIGLWFCGAMGLVASTCDLCGGRGVLGDGFWRSGCWRCFICKLWNCGSLQGARFRIARFPCGVVPEFRVLGLLGLEVVNLELC